MTSPQQQQGVALITTLLVFAIAAILTTQIVRQTQADIQRTAWTVDTAQAYQNALGAEALARIELATVLQNGHVNELLSPQLPLATDNGLLLMEFVDLQGRINLNNLAGKSNYPTTVKRFFAQQQTDPNLGDALMDWIDSDAAATGFGGEDQRYAGREPPYRTANQPLINSGDILAVATINHDTYARLAPYIAALPEITPININSAPAEVIAAISPGLDGLQVVNARAGFAGGFQSVAEFLQSAVTAGIELDATLIDVKSRWFAVKIRSEFGDRHVTLFSRFRIDSESGKITVYDRVSGIPLAIHAWQSNDKENNDNDIGPIF